MYKIYKLLDPNGIPFYVGCTMQKLGARVSHHKKNKKPPYTKVYKKILELNRKITIELIAQEEQKNKAFELEQYWICRYIEEGYPLCNKAKTPYTLEKRKITSTNKVGYSYNDGRYKGRYYERTFIKTSFTSEEMAAISSYKRFGEAIKAISNTTGYSEEMVRITLKNKRKYVCQALYSAICKFYSIEERQLS